MINRLPTSFFPRLEDALKNLSGQFSNCNCVTVLARLAKVSLGSVAHHESSCVYALECRRGVFAYEQNVFGGRHD